MNHPERRSKQQKEQRKEEKFQRGLSIKRVQILCDSLENGSFNPGKAQLRLDLLPVIRPDKQESNSLNNVKTALGSFPFIDRIIGTSHCSYEDSHLKYDLIANLNDQNLDFIGIQVKSSRRGVTRFFEKINPNYPEIKNQDVLNQRCLVVLNGQESISTIQENFLTQFAAVNDFYSGKKTKYLFQDVLFRH